MDKILSNDIQDYLPKKKVESVNLNMFRLYQYYNYRYHYGVYDETTTANNTYYVRY